MVVISVISGQNRSHLGVSNGLRPLPASALKYCRRWVTGILQELAAGAGSSGKRATHRFRAAAVEVRPALDAAGAGRGVRPDNGERGKGPTSPLVQSAQRTIVPARPLPSWMRPFDRTNAELAVVQRGRDVGGAGRRLQLLERDGERSRPVGG